MTLCTDATHCLESIDIPDSVSVIEAGAFRNCSNLRTISIPDSVIKANTFYNCTALSMVKIKNGTTYIGFGVFTNCGRLKEIEIPETLTRINNGFSKGTQLIFSGGITDSLINIYAIEGKKTGVSLEWNKVKDASGYQIMYSDRKDFKNAVTVEGSNNRFQKKFSKGSRKYYIKIRAYQITNGSKSYGAWCEAKTF